MGGIFKNLKKSRFVEEWFADVTHDGKPDRIEVDLTNIVSDIQNAGDNIRIYSGATGKIIWSRLVSTEHVGQSGIYLYNDEGKYYIMIWEPYIDIGKAAYHYEILELSDTGKVQVIKSGNFSFSFNNIQKDDIENLKAFAGEVNQFLEKSIVLLDTNNFQTLFSTNLNKVVNTYDYEDDLKLMDITNFVYR